ncbi:hypothetical protein KCU61_g76, partial [Aureobasidium melanogenum]
MDTANRFVQCKSRIHLVLSSYSDMHLDDRVCLSAHLQAVQDRPDKRLWPRIVLGLTKLDAAKDDHVTDEAAEGVADTDHLQKSIDVVSSVDNIVGSDDLLQHGIRNNVAKERSLDTCTETPELNEMLEVNVHVLVNSASRGLEVKFLAENPLTEHSERRVLHDVLELNLFLRVLGSKGNSKVVTVEVEEMVFREASDLGRDRPLAWDRAAVVDVVCLGLVDDVDGRFGTGWWERSNGIIRNPCLGFGIKVLLLVRQRVGESGDDKMRSGWCVLDDDRLKLGGRSDRGHRAFVASGRFGNGGRRLWQRNVLSQRQSLQSVVGTRFAHRTRREVGAIGLRYLSVRSMAVGDRSSAVGLSVGLLGDAAESGEQLMRAQVCGEVSNDCVTVSVSKIGKGRFALFAGGGVSGVGTSYTSDSFSELVSSDSFSCVSDATAQGSSDGVSQDMSAKISERAVCDRARFVAQLEPRD